MTRTMDDEKFRLIAQAVEPHATLLRVYPLDGGLSAQVTVLEILRSDGQTVKMIIRQHGQADRERNPGIAADEFRLLEILHAAGLPAPAPLYLDASGTIFAEPYLMVEYIEGQTEFAPSNLDHYIAQIAATLANIHLVNVKWDGLSFLPDHNAACAQQLSEYPAMVDHSLDEGRIREVLATAWPFEKANQPVLLHGDYWPGNIVWQGGQIAAVIDWEDAALGDPLADLSCIRLEILWTFGVEAMVRFTQTYQSLTNIDLEYLPYWDLFAALRPTSRLSEWAGDAGRERTMREWHRYFVRQATAKLGA